MYVEKTYIVITKDVSTEMFFNFSLKNTHRHMCIQKTIKDIQFKGMKPKKDVITYTK